MPIEPQFNDQATVFQQRFEPGDIFISATWREGDIDIRRNFGAGRVLHLSPELEPKSALWTGQTGLVVGLGVAPDGALYATDPTSKVLTCFPTDGSAGAEVPSVSGVGFGCVDFDAQGSIYLGEHIKGDKPPFVGGGEIYALAQNGDRRSHFAADRDPGKFGFHGVTTLHVSAAGRQATYISETGKRVMRYDMATDRQATDLFCLGDDDERVTAGFDVLPDGSILMSHVYGVSLFDPEGETIRQFPVPEDRGWAAVRLTRDGTAFLVANFFTGSLHKYALDSGELLATFELSMPFTLAGIAEA